MKYVHFSLFIEFFTTSKIFSNKRDLFEKAIQSGIKWIFQIFKKKFKVKKKNKGEKNEAFFYWGYDFHIPNVKISTEDDS